MTKRLAVLIATAALGGTPGFAAPSHADAAASHCQATGTMALDAGVGTVGVYAAVNTTFTISRSGGTCTSVDASGSGSFNCGSGVGSGTIWINGSAGHGFSFSADAFTLIGAPGVVSFNGVMLPDATRPGSCNAGTATSFQVVIDVAHH